jgi:parallel beta-helix repeat protein
VSPYRLSTNGGYTLVLTPRSEPYRIKDLLQLAPQTFLRLTDGSYVLGESLIVMPGATLTLAQPGGLTLRMASSAKGFTSIVSLGGTLRFEGETRAPLTVTSWDVGDAKTDTDTSDGRAYVRAVGGRFIADWVNVRDLGFWSGRTGGLALTGTDRPFTGTLESGAPSAADVGAAKDKATISPAGALPNGESNPLATYEMPSLAYVSSAISHTTIDGNAYGLFISDADSIQISDTSVRHSLSDGVVLHRYVSNGLIERTLSSDNAGDGFQLDRATQAITLTQTTAKANAGNGFTISGRPLAEGPSASGASLDSYGNNTVNNSTASDNGRYGIDVVGGFNVTIQGNAIEGNDMGIVVRQGASRVVVTANDVRASNRHAIALTDGVNNSVVNGNLVDEAATGIYLRASSATVKGNTVQSASAHGISLVGAVGGSSVSYNAISGSGTSAIDSARASGHTDRDGNSTAGWHDTRGWVQRFRSFAHPSTALWVAIFLMLVISALRSRRTDRGGEHPYARQNAARLAGAQIDLRRPEYERVD